MGGEVFWAGKPHASAYGAALAMAAEIRGQAIDTRRILAIGDSARTDIAGATGAGLDALFIGHGIHRDEVMDDGRLMPAALARLFPERSRPVAAIASLAW